MKCTFLFVVTILLIFYSCEAKVFEKCELVQELMKQGFPKEELPDWNCLVEAGSCYKTDAIKPPKSPNRRFYKYGLFQVNNVFECKDGKPGGLCKVDCNDLLTDDITAASKCALHIKEKFGFKAWHSWRRNCRRGPLPDISDCFKESLTENQLSE